MSVLLVLVGCDVALLVVLLVGDVRTGGGLRRAWRGNAPIPPVGFQERPVVEIRGTTPDGAPTTVGLTGNVAPTLLVFLGSTCVTCRELWRDARQATREAGTLRIVVVTRGPGSESAPQVAKRSHDPESVVMSDSAWDLYGISRAPAFVVVDGRDGSGTPLSTVPTWRDVLVAARNFLATRDAP